MSDSVVRLLTAAVIVVGLASLVLALVMMQASYRLPQIEMVSPTVCTQILDSSPGVPAVAVACP